MMHTILLIDDDKELAELLTTYFSRYDLQLLSRTHPSQGLLEIKQNPDIQLLILDIMLPEMDGFEVCRELRKTNHLPILMLSARGDVTDRIVGLEMGADDYLPKPFEPRELVARVHSILKRQQLQTKKTSQTLSWSCLEIKTQQRQCFLNQQRLELTTKEYELLLLLAQNQQKNFTRDEIMNHLHGIDATLFSRSIDILISRLRHKLKPLNCIKTVWGRGYCFIPPE